MQELKPVSQIFFTAGVALALSLGGLIPAASAQEGDSVVVDIGECVNITSAQARFECYERLAAEQAPKEVAAPPEPEPPAADSPDTPAEAAPPVAERTRPSLSERRAMRRAERERERAQRALAPEEPEEQEEPGYLATISGLRETVPNAWRVTLDNGEVWQQVDPKPYRLRVGMQVRLYTTNWGSSHRLTATNLNGFIRVREIR